MGTLKWLVCTHFGRDVGGSENIYGVCTCANYNVGSSYKEVVIE